MKSGCTESSGGLGASNTPAQDLYLADPSRLAVLNIKIIAQASIEDDDASTSSSAPLCTLTTSPLPITPSKVAFPSCPPSSYKSPVRGSSSLPTNTRSRPRSLDLGHRAKEALLDVGQGVNQGWRNRTRTDLSETNDQATSVDVAPGRTASQSSTSSNSLKASTTDSDLQKRPKGRFTHARRVYSLRPDKRSFRAGESPSSTSVALQMSSKMEVSRKASRSYPAKLHWDSLGSTNTDFVRDDGANQTDGRAGVFSAAEDGELDSEASEDDSDEEDTIEAYGQISDTRQLLLKIITPLQYLQQQNTQLAGRESSSITLKTRLRIGSTSAKTLRSSRTPPAGPRSPKRNTSDRQSRGRIIFVSTDSSHKLHEAVDSTRLRQDGMKFTGPLSSQEAARLEGIDLVPVEGEVQNSSGVTSFEWEWKSLKRDSAHPRNVLGDSTVRCACAFIELNVAQATARILASFCFMIALPPTSALELGDGATLAVQQTEMTQSYCPQLIDRGVGLGLCDVGVAASASSASLAMPFSSTNNNGGLYSRLRRVSGGAMGLYSPSKARRQLSAGSQNREELISAPIEGSASNIVSLQLNFAEIGLDDVEEDGPIMRAAVSNLEKRTTSLKRTAKAIVKAAEEVRANLCQLQASEASLSHSLEASAHLTPFTLGYLQSQLLQKKQKEDDQYREQRIEMLQIHVEAPLLALIEKCRTFQEQSKTFELESRVYYTGTQKWLPSRSSAPVAASTENAEVYSSSAVAYDKASHKQDKVDDKQRLRQARFHLARLDVFRAVIDVHGGEAELQLASHFLTICRWQCFDEEGKSILDSFENALRLERSKVQRRSKEIYRKYLEVQQQINELHGLLGKAALDTEVEMAAILPSSESDATLGAKSRQTGNRFKNLLSSLGSSKQPSAVALPASTCTAQQDADSSPMKWSPIQSRNKVVAKVSHSAAATENGHPSFVNLQQKSRPLSFVQCQEAPQESVSYQRPASASNLRSPVPMCRSASIGVASPKEDDFYRYPSSPSPQRSSSNSSALASPRRREALLDSAAANQLVNNADDYTLGGSNASTDARTHMQAAAATSMKKTTNQPQPSRMSLLQPRRAAQQSRKKEGILWAMSKPIAGAGGTDAPKSASRSQNWRECWVVLSGSGHLGQYAEWKDVKIMEPSNPLIDLRFATVREARGVERRFTFEVVTRENRRFFQANNEEEMKNWMSAISFAIESLLNGTSSIRQIDKVARVAGVVASCNGQSDEFGSQAGTGMIEPSALGRHRAFSQSLTDLSTASNGGPGRLFSRGGNREETGRKRDSKGSNSITSGHLSALSEGGVQYTSASDYPSSPNRPTPWNNHERGISNKTPVSGYVQQLECDVVESSVPILSSWTLERDYDRKIEEMVHSSFGGSDHAHQRSLSLLSSISPSRQSSQTSQKDAIAAMTTSSSSTKYTRSKEIVEIAARSENSYCADCRIENPRWASWSINGEPRCIFICIICSGYHRGLGVGVSRVKSVDLDDWTEEQMESAREWGNDRVNDSYEATKPKGNMVVTTKGKQFCTDKYVSKIWFEQKVEKQSIPVKRAEGVNTAGLPRWPSSPPVVFVSMLDSGGEVTKWKNPSSASHTSPSTSTDEYTARVSFEDEASFQTTSPPIQSFHRFPRRSIEKKIAV